MGFPGKVVSRGIRVKPRLQSSEVERAMIGKTKQLRAPANGKTDVYMTVRSTPEYAVWLAGLARMTHRSRQEVLQYSVEKYSAEHGHPNGIPPERTILLLSQISRCLWV